MKHNKASFPPLAGRLIPRTKLYGILGRLLSKEKKSGRVICVAASAGYGKTTAVSSWLSQAQHPHVWLSLAPGDNSPAAFFSRFCTSFSPESFSGGTISLLDDPLFIGAPIEYALKTLFTLNRKKREEGGPGEKMIFVMDNTHLITHKGILGALPYVLQGLPEETEILLLGRGGALMEGLARKFGSSWLREPHLRFSPMEVRRCFASVGREISGVAAGNIARRTGGWPIAVAAFADLLPPGYSSDIELKEKSALDEWVSTHFWEPCGEKIRDFLLRTCIVDELTPELCKQLIGSYDDVEIIWDLLASHSFLGRRIAEKTWVYHPLFRDFLRGKLAEKKEEDICVSVPALYADVSDYYFDRRDSYRSIRFALLCKEATRVARAFRDVMRYDIYNNSVEGHVDKIAACLAEDDTEEMLQTYPYLYVAVAWHAHLTGNAGAAEAAFDKLYEKLPEIAYDHGEFLELAILLHTLDHRYPGGNFFDRVPEKTREDLKKTKREKTSFPCMSKNLPFAHKGAKDLCDFPGLPFERALFDQAGFLWGKGGEALSLAVSAGLWYERNDLQQALLCIEEAHSRLPQNAVPDMIFFTNMTKSAVLDAMERQKDAEEELASVFSYLTDSGALYLLPNLQAYEIKSRLLNGDSDAAAEWLKRHFVQVVLDGLYKKVPGDDTENPAGYPMETKESGLELFRIFQHLTTARALMAVSTLAKARDFIARVILLAKTFRRVTDQAEALVLASILEWSRGDRKAAVPLFQEAISAVRPYRHIRLFADEGANILPILRRYARHPETGDMSEDEKSWLREIRTAAFFRADKRAGIGAAMHSKKLILSKRQEEILGYLSRGYARNEIADETGMSLSTVKTHIQIAYRKLDAKNADEAVRKAKKQRLIQ